MTLIEVRAGLEINPDAIAMIEKNNDGYYTVVFIGGRTLQITAEEYATITE